VRGHWLEMGMLYKRFIPGEVTPDTTDAIGSQLSREASGLAHRQEFEADAFAMQMLHRLGRPSEDAYSAFMHLGMTQDTATHPGTRKRVMLLRTEEMSAGHPE